MNLPSRAIVLAAGYGTRLRPLTLQRPKPLVPFWGEPLLAHTLRQLRTWGVRDVLINLHHAPPALVDFCRTHRETGLRRNLSYEPVIMGTGGVLHRAAWFVQDAPFWMVNGDIAMDLDPSRLRRFFERRSGLACLWVTDTSGPRTVQVDQGAVRNFHAVSPGSPGTFTFCGLHLLHPAILDYLPNESPCSIITAYTHAMAQGRTIAATSVEESFWADVGSPRAYLDAHRAALAARRARRPGRNLVPTEALKRQENLRKKAHVTGFVAAGRDVRVAAGAVLHDSVLWDHSRIGARSRLRSAIVAGTTVRGPASCAAVPAQSLDDRDIDTALAQLGWPANRTTAMPLAPRGSSRRFIRVDSPRGHAIVMVYGPEREENLLYARHARFLENMGLRVPRVLLHMPRHGLAVLEDLGECHVKDIAGGLSRRSVIRLYKRILNQVILMHRRGINDARQQSLPLNPPFSAPLYRWEHDLFIDAFARPILRVPARTCGQLRCELQSVAERLLALPEVLLHRDLQSSNILVCNRQPAFIDFQGMRTGPAAYDLASLLYDPYVCLPEPVQTRLLRHYTLATGDATLPRVLPFAAVQRLAQALGAYGRLSASPGTRDFAAHIPPALHMMQRALRLCTRLSALSRLVNESLGKARRSTAAFGPESVFPG